MPVVSIFLNNGAIIHEVRWRASTFEVDLAQASAVECSRVTSMKTFEHLHIDGVKARVLDTTYMCM